MSFELFYSFEPVYLLCLSGLEKIHHKKEKKIKNLLDSHQIQIESYDRRIGYRCNYRPDFLLNFGNFKVILEVDEFQYKRYKFKGEIVDNYKSSNEKERMIQIFKELKSCPLLFIRYNPDPYIDQGGNSIKPDDTKRGQFLIDQLKELKRSV